MNQLVQGKKREKLKVRRVVKAALLLSVRPHQVIRSRFHRPKVGLSTMDALHFHKKSMDSTFAIFTSAASRCEHDEVSCIGSKENTAFPRVAVTPAPNVYSPLPWIAVFPSPALGCSTFEHIPHSAPLTCHGFHAQPPVQLNSIVVIFQSTHEQTHEDDMQPKWVELLLIHMYFYDKKKARQFMRKQF